MHRSRKLAVAADEGSGYGGFDVSDVGRFVVFTSGAHWADPKQIRSNSHVFLRDRVRGVTTLVSRDLAPGGFSHSRRARMISRPHRSTRHRTSTCWT